VLPDLKAAKDEVTNGKVVDRPCCLHNAATKVQSGGGGYADGEVAERTKLGNLVIHRVQTGGEDTDEHL
jgi:hypothetical protein